MPPQYEIHVEWEECHRSLDIPIDMNLDCNSSDPTRTSHSNTFRIEKINTTNRLNSRFLLWHIVFRIIILIGQAAKHVDFVSNHRKRMAETGSRRKHSALRWSRSNLFPLPIGHFHFVQITTVLAILHHSAKHKYPIAIGGESISGTAWWNVTTHWRRKPLIGSCNIII